MKFPQGSKSKMDLSLFIQLIPNSCLTNSPALSGRRRVNRGPTKQTQEIRRWKLRELIRSRRAKVRRSGSQVQFESNQCLKVRNRHVRVARASRLSRVHAHAPTPADVDRHFRP